MTVDVVKNMGASVRQRHAILEAGLPRVRFRNVPSGPKKSDEGRSKIGIRILIVRVGIEVGNDVENRHIQFIFNACESLGGNQDLISNL